MARQYDGRVTVVGMAGRDTIDAMRSFVDEHELGFLDHAVDEDGSLWRHFGVSGQPAWVFVTADGDTRVSYGVLTHHSLRAELDRLAP